MRLYRAVAKPFRNAAYHGFRRGAGICELPPFQNAAELRVIWRAARMTRCAEVSRVYRLDTRRRNAVDVVGVSKRVRIESHSDSKSSV